MRPSVPPPGAATRLGRDARHPGGARHRRVRREGRAQEATGLLRSRRPTAKAGIARRARPRAGGGRRSKPSIPGRRRRAPATRTRPRARCRRHAEAASGGARRAFRRHDPIGRKRLQDAPPPRRILDARRLSASDHRARGLDFPRALGRRRACCCRSRDCGCFAALAWLVVAFIAQFFRDPPRTRAARAQCRAFAGRRQGRQRREDARPVSRPRRAQDQRVHERVQRAFEPQPGRWRGRRGVVPRRQLRQRRARQGLARERAQRAALEDRRRAATSRACRSRA